MSGEPPYRPRAAIFGCSGETLTADERAFFADADPLGFILFRRNCRDPEQIRRLTDALREAVGRADAPVMIDQEGGRVQRLRPPHWRDFPAAARIGALSATDPDGAARAAWALGRLIADALRSLGVTVDALPVLDLRLPGASQAIGDRAFSADPEVVSRLGRAAADGLMAGGVIPVAKHLPGHGRAQVDSHVALPVVDATLETLARSDFRPFRSLADLPWGLTAHVVFTAVDPAQPATLSKTVIDSVIRGQIGFDGLLLSDDLCMDALAGPPAVRADAALAAGCDVALHCNGDLDEMQSVAASVDTLRDAAMHRLNLGWRRVHAAPDPIDRADLADRLADLPVAA